MSVVTDEELWASEYGIQYSTKFNVEWRDRIPLLRDILQKTGARSVVDVGTNLGWNLRALREIDPTLELMGVEINEWAAAGAAAMGFKVLVAPARALGEAMPGGFDLAITSGLLIHVPTDLLRETMQSIMRASRKWVLAIEYRAPKEEVRIEKFGAPRTWNRPYGALYEQLGLRERDFGFCGTDYQDCHWWLMEKA